MAGKRIKAIVTGRSREDSEAEVKYTLTAYQAGEHTSVHKLYDELMEKVKTKVVPVLGTTKDSLLIDVVHPVTVTIYFE